MFTVMAVFCALDSFSLIKKFDFGKFTGDSTMGMVHPLQVMISNQLWMENKVFTGEPSEKCTLISYPCDHKSPVY